MIERGSPRETGVGMTESGVDRRDFIFGLAGAAFAGLASACGALRAVAEYAASVPPEQAFEFFTPEQAREFDSISAQIVPTDDTPGAREANAVRFVDRYLATIARDAQPRFLTDLQRLGDAVAARTRSTRSFTSLSDADQIACLTAFEQSDRGAFDRFRSATMLGMLSDPVHGGNSNKVGWTLIGFDDRHSWAPPFGYYDRV